MEQLTSRNLLLDGHIHCSVVVESNELARMKAVRSGQAWDGQGWGGHDAYIDDGDHRSSYPSVFGMKDDNAGGKGGRKKMEENERGREREGIEVGRRRGRPGLGKK